MITLSVDDQREVTRLMEKMLYSIDPEGTHLTANGMEEAFRLLSDKVQVIFLDIEMSGLNGIEAADLLQKRYPTLNIVFVTGHPEYSLSAHGVFPSGFLTKPVDEQDIRRVLAHLRYPIENEESSFVVRCAPFAVFKDGKPFDFKSGKTLELFAYMVYKNGAYCSNGELIGILWEGDMDKSVRLRQLVMDLRASLSEIGMEHIVVKKYGRIGLEMEHIKCEGEKENIRREYNWY